MQPNETSRPAFRSTLSQLELRSPPLPHTLLEAMELIDRPDQLEVEPVIEMVQRDPIVVARLLQIVNSAYYGLQRSIDSVDRAVVLLGPVAVTGIVLGMNMLKLRSALEGPASHCFIRLIRHSIATAFLTRHLMEGPPRLGTPHNRLRRTGTSFTAGLLHDFGKIILVYNFPREAVELYEQRVYEEQIRTDDIRSLEQLLFGYDHTEAGEYVARKLGFPEILVNVIRLHHEPVPGTGDAETDHLIRTTVAADLTAKALGYPFHDRVSREQCLAHPVWREVCTGTSARPAPEALSQELQAVREHLDAYVRHMTASLSSPPSAEARARKRNFRGLPGPNVPRS